MARKAHPNPAAPYHTPSRATQSRETAERLLFFSQKYTSLNLPGLHNLLPFKGADYRSPIQTKKMTSKQAIYLHG